MRAIRGDIRPPQPPPPPTPREPPGPPPAPPPDETDEQTVMLAFIAQHKELLRYNHSAKQWLHWTGHYWKRDNIERAFNWSLSLARSLKPAKVHRKIRFGRAIEEGARAQPEVATEQEQWDQNPWLIGTPGGVVELTTGELRGGQPDDLISMVTRVTPAEHADCPRWIDFIAYALNDDADVIGFFQRWCGYVLTGSTREEKFLFQYGPEGTGKGTSTKTIMQIMGDYAHAAPVSMITDAAWRQLEYYRAKLPGKRLILCSEPPAGSAWSESFVNELTGGDRLSGRHPSGRPFDFDPTHKLSIHGNAIPNLKSVGTGLKRRLLLTGFTRPPTRPDASLKDRLAREHPAILRWMIDGALAWQQQSLNPPASVRQATSEYFASQDVLARFVDEKCELADTFNETPGTLRNAYNNWAYKNQERQMNSREFHDAIEKFPNLRQTLTHGTNYIRGIRVKSVSE